MYVCVLSSKYTNILLSYNRYKTSVLYGKKVIVLSEDLAAHQHQLLRLSFARKTDLGSTPPKVQEISVHIVTDLLIQVRKDFTLETSLNALTATFKAANVYKTTEKDDRVSPSRIRASVATELAGLGDEDLKVSYLIIELCFVVCFH